MAAPSDATRRPRRPPGHSPNNANPVHPQSVNRPLVTIGKIMGRQRALRQSVMYNAEVFVAGT